MIFYEILTNIIYTSIGENIQHNKKQKKLTIKAGMILVHMSAQCPDLGGSTVANKFIEISKSTQKHGFNGCYGVTGYADSEYDIVFNL